jgi:hypothetical protein
MLSAKYDAEVTTEPQVNFYIFNASQEKLPSSIRVHWLPRSGHANYTGRFITFSVITNIYNKKTKGPILMELFTATGKPKKFFFYN